MINNAHSILEKQKAFFNKGLTLNPDFRVKMLKKLKASIENHENEIYEALRLDLGKSEFESYTTEVACVYSEINFHIKNLKKLSRDRSAKTPLFLFPARSRIHFEPYGSVLIIVPWNYPLQLAFMPLIAAIAAGNTAVVKISEFTVNVAEVTDRILRECFPEEYVVMAEGGVEESTELLREPFDFIFFTGSPRVGKIVMKAASENLTPVVLELGGKSPVIIDESADMRISMKRLLFGKLMNSGQTCVAPDYVLIEKSRKSEFIELFSEVLDEFFENKSPDDVNTYAQLSRIINEKNYRRILSLIEGENIIYGGTDFPDALKIAPVLLDCGNASDYLKGKEKTPVLKEEIFGPVLPLIVYDNIQDAINYIKNDFKPLSLYVFTKNQKNAELVVKSLSYGGGCINDTVVHLSNINLPFGGVGNSGMGFYHGKYSFETFSHRKSVLNNPLWFDLKAKYMPYDSKKLDFVKKFFK